MDPGSILLALQEHTRWRDRRQRLEERLRATQDEKLALQKELEALRRRIARLEKDLRGSGVAME